MGRRLAGEISGERSPNDGDVDFLVENCVDDGDGSVALSVIAVDHVTATFSVNPRAAIACAGGVFMASFPIN